MNQFDDYIGRCKALAMRAAEAYPAVDLDLVLHLIDHSEAPIALGQMAWMIHNSGLNIPADLIEEVKALISEMEPEEHLPPPFRSGA
jgi:hypothetical protein